jgi:hypothetical protein
MTTRDLRLGARHGSQLPQTVTLEDRVAQLARRGAPPNKIAADVDRSARQVRRIIDLLKCEGKL